MKISGVVNFNAYFGCQKCIIKGEYSMVSRTMTYPQTHCPMRTNESFRKQEQIKHHQTKSLIEEINDNLDMVADFPTSDALHLFDLGIMKRCLMRWKDGTRSYKARFSSADMENVNKLLGQANQEKPSEIHRAIRSLNMLSDWKGTEYRTFLLYIGMVVLKDILISEEYFHFLKLCCAVALCSSNSYRVYVTPYWY